MLIVVEKQNAGFLGLILVERDWPIRAAERRCPLALSFIMAQHTPPRPDEHINMELEDSAIDDTGAQSAAAAAAAALVALPQAAAAAAADGGQHQPYSERCPRLSRLQRVLIDAPVCAAHCCVDAPLVCAGPVARVDSAGKQVCQRGCGRRVSRIPHHRADGPGRSCHPKCAPKAAAASAAAPFSDAAPPAAPKRSHKRARSDPGEPSSERTPSPPRVRPSTRRVTPPAPAQASKKQRTTRQDERIMRLLEETHARRMAAETAAAAVAAGTLAVAGGAAYSCGASQ